MPTIRLARSVAPVRYRSAGAPPAPGTVPASGVPATSGPAGNIAFTTSILIAFPSSTVTPSINRGTFPGLLAYGIGNLVSGASASAADIAIGVAPSTSAADVENVQRAWTFASDLLSPQRGGWVSPATASATWVTISGSFNATQGWTLANLNRAIARAFANSVTFPPPAAPQLQSRMPAPNDGNPLLATLSQGTACSGFRDYARVYAAACTRWATMRPAPTPVVLPPAPLPTPTPVVQPALAPALCTTPVRSIFYLRPTATFAHTGPTLPVGTVVDVLEVTPQTQGTFRLYRVRIARTQTVAAARAYIDRVGYAALDANDVAACPSGIVRPSAPVTPPPAVRPPAAPTPVTPTVRPPTTVPTPVAPRPTTPVVTPTPGAIQPTPQQPPLVRQETGGGPGVVLPAPAPQAPAAKSNTPYIVAGVGAVAAVSILLVATLTQGPKKRP